MKVTQSNVQEAMRKKSKTPMSKDRDKTPACNRGTDLQLWSNKYSMMLILAGSLKLKVKSSQKSDILTNFEALYPVKKRRKRRKTHQKGSDQRTEAFFDAQLAPSANRASLRNLFKKQSLQLLSHL